MKELATLLLKSLSSAPENVVVEETEEDNKIYLTTKVDAADKGKVIGKDGCIIKAVRTVLSAAASKQNKKVTLKLED
ncbi:KH domain-containing protein [Candidatus Avelusimicrobium faecicola]|uniref:KH domain-containing protein n=1 Tax=Candidatus Avelusimicrobium faecicola TaxID=3416205 RepID=UPI0015A37798|nr:KH domain-containing protein [Spirochaetota bacterium]MCI7535723.1 KH domain-containing protein [Spirochaetota bacterium]MDE3277297.1 KH domain-containing protein [Spirochaetota bacterium]MDY2940011.1 KH domain-containing protein [Elusimicrobiaceae bacterium]MDY6129052.1 KH domain-containing protein [Elusimicrobiaceae bacterium]